MRTAVGFDEARGDTIEVVNLRFAESPVNLDPVTGDAGFLTLTKDDYFYVAEIAVLLIIALLVLLLVVRPLVRRILTESESAPAIAADPAQTALAAPEGHAKPALPGPASETEPPPKPEFIESAKAAGKIQAAAMEQVGQIVESNPTEAVSVLRQWIQEPA